VSLVADYSSRSLIDKLGIRPGTEVILLGGPPGYAAMLGELPPGAVIKTRLPAGARFIHQFARLRIELEAAFPRGQSAG
jgi:hypothetical protein